ncbi:hypothetical protein [Phytoactinopolyspora mesophila]|uniref:Uncharacterized protein n=1 Tax=Phytoactinopolyspora mesophila TaxID=2650750 RepID=A0A7K3M8M2_9ACTN|nr:hypothetical protein [Phytoactinopolyspora mesophila]NDL59634.1 hypothetical protein [Phytoactinopolyspora mesophila]
MGLIDRVKELFSRDEGVDTPPVIPLDTDARRAQLDELEDALRTLARAMAEVESRMTNPGWRGRVEDLRFAANEASRLAHEGFDRAALHDLAAEVRPLYGRGDVPAEYQPFTAEHERVLSATAALRADLASERDLPPDE